MKLNISKTIDENVISVDISVAELGTSDTDAATEKICCIILLEQSNILRYPLNLI